MPRQEWSGWELRAGFLGTVRVTVPLTALYTEPCCIEVHEALITVRPRPPGAPRRDAANASNGASWNVAHTAAAQRSNGGRSSEFRKEPAA